MNGFFFIIRLIEMGITHEFHPEQSTISSEIIKTNTAINIIRFLRDKTRLLIEVC